MTGSKSESTVAYGFLSIVVAGYLIAVLWFPLAYLYGTYEDLFGEWLQFWLQMVAFVLAVRLARTPSRFRWFFGILALCCLYVALEEISWGQRLFGFATPELFEQYNLQQETNLHNLLVGPYDTLTKRIIEIALASALVLYGLIYPAGLRLGWRWAMFADRHGLAAPPGFLWPYFTLAALLELRLFRFNEAEIAEILVGAALVMLAGHYLIRQRTERRDHRLARLLAWPLLSGLVLAAATSGLVYSSPGQRLEIEDRLTAGAQKYVHRYEERGQWDAVIRLYQFVIAREQPSSAHLRSLADAYLHTGNPENFRHYNQEALEADIRYLAVSPDSVSLRLSLATTFEQRGDAEQALLVRRRALALALQHISENPESASAAHWLGRVYLSLDAPELGLKYLERAARLDPASERYARSHMAEHTTH